MRDMEGTSSPPSHTNVDATGNEVTHADNQCLRHRRDVRRQASTRAKDLATAVMRWEGVPATPLFSDNTAAFVHDLPARNRSFCASSFCESRVVSRIHVHFMGYFNASFSRRGRSIRPGSRSTPTTCPGATRSAGPRVIEPVPQPQSSMLMLIAPVSKSARARTKLAAPRVLVGCYASMDQAPATKPTKRQGTVWLTPAWTYHLRGGSLRSSSSPYRVLDAAPRQASARQPSSDIASTTES